MKIKEIRLVTVSRRCSKKSTKILWKKPHKKKWLSKVKMSSSHGIFHGISRNASTKRWCWIVLCWTNISVAPLLMYFSEEIIFIILIWENKNTKTLNRFKLFYKFYEIATNHFPYELFLKEQKTLCLKKYVD